MVIYFHHTNLIWISLRKVSYLSACCRAACADEQGIMAIEFTNFTDSALNHVSIESFIKNSNFTTRIDSTNRKAFPGVNFILLNETQDWRISIEQEKYLITNITTQIKHCSICTEAPDYKKVKSFLLNGQLTFESKVTLKKL